MNEIIYVDYKKFLEITGISESEYKKRENKSKSKRLESKGYIVKNIKGKGLNTVFECEMSEKLKLENQIKGTLGVDINNVFVMDIYLNMLIEENGVDYMFKSDREIAEIIKSGNHHTVSKYTINTLRKYILYCRKELVECGWMKPIVKNKNEKYCTEKVYKIVNVEEGINKEITIEEFNKIYSELYFKNITENIKIAKSIGLNLDKESLSNIASKARVKMFKAVGGMPVPIYKKDFKLGGFND